MKRLLLLLLIITASFATYAQQTYSVQCQMTIAEIETQQSWDVDDYRTENVREISTIFFSELNELFDKLNADDSEIQENIDAINAAIEKAEMLGMNYSMFDNDLSIVANL